MATIGWSKIWDYEWNSDICLIAPNPWKYFIPDSRETNEFTALAFEAASLLFFNYFPIAVKKYMTKAACERKSLLGARLPPVNPRVY